MEFSKVRGFGWLLRRLARERKHPTVDKNLANSSSRRPLRIKSMVIARLIRFVEVKFPKEIWNCRGCCGDVPFIQFFHGFPIYFFPSREFLQLHFARTRIAAVQSTLESTRNSLISICISREAFWDWNRSRISVRFVRLSSFLSGAVCNSYRCNNLSLTRSPSA